MADGTSANFDSDHIALFRWSEGSFKSLSAACFDFIAILVSIHSHGSHQPSLLQQQQAALEEALSPRRPLCGSRRVLKRILIRRVTSVL